MAATCGSRAMARPSSQGLMPRVRPASGLRRSGPVHCYVFAVGWCGMPSWRSQMESADQRGALDQLTLVGGVAMGWPSVSIEALFVDGTSTLDLGRPRCRPPHQPYR